MQVNSVGTVNNTSFGHRHEKKSGGAGKAWCSTFIPGLGQFLDGRNAAGAFYMGAETMLLGTAAALSFNLGKAVEKGINAKNEKLIEEVISKRSTLFKSLGVVASSLGFGALRLADIVSAYKGRKEDNHPKHHRDVYYG